MQRNGKWGTRHTFDTARPQSYYEHWRVAWFGSWSMMAIALGGVVHSVLPEIKRFQFTVPNWVVKTAVIFMRDPRHTDIITKYITAADIEHFKKCLDRK